MVKGEVGVVAGRKLAEAKFRCDPEIALRVDCHRLDVVRRVGEAAGPKRDIVPVHAVKPVDAGAAHAGVDSVAAFHERLRTAEIDVRVMPVPELLKLARIRVPPAKAVAADPED